MTGLEPTWLTSRLPTTVLKELWILAATGCTTPGLLATAWKVDAYAPTAWAPEKVLPKAPPTRAGAVTREVAV